VGTPALEGGRLQIEPLLDALQPVLDPLEIIWVRSTRRDLFQIGQCAWLVV
jgi:hypothetical protein